MMGPSCSVLCTNAVHAWELVEELIELVANDEDGDIFTVTDTRPIKGHYAGAARSFVFFRDSWDTEDIARIAQASGWNIDHEIGLAAIGDGPEDRRILGELALWLAERLGGYVDIGAALTLQGELLANAFLLPAVTGSVADHTTVFNPAGLAAWLASPEFRMVK